MFRRDFIGSVLGLISTTILPFSIKSNPLTLKDGKIFHNKWGELKEVTIESNFNVSPYQITGHRYVDFPTETNLTLNFETVKCKWATFNLPTTIFCSCNKSKIFESLSKVLLKSEFPSMGEDKGSWDLVINAHRFKPVYFIKTIT